MAERIVGRVKWFNPTKGYGFIGREDGGSDVFVHINAVQNSGLSGLKENDKISFELVTNERTHKESAEHLQLA